MWGLLRVVNREKCSTLVLNSKGRGPTRMAPSFCVWHQVYLGHIPSIALLWCAQIPVPPEKS